MEELFFRGTREELKGLLREEGAYPWLPVLLEENFLTYEHLASLEKTPIEIEGLLPKQFRPADLNQTFALDLLRRLDVPLTALIGRAGTGKTFLVLAVCYALLQRKQIDGIIITKPMVSVGKGKFWGALPGGIEEKIMPFLESFWDAASNLDLTLWFEKALTSKVIEVAPIEFLRGRSFEKKIVVCDEAQNLTNIELLTLGTRIGQKSKLVLLGDLNQKDIQEESALKRLLYDPRYWRSPLTSFIELRKVMRNQITLLIEEILST